MSTWIGSPNYTQGRQGKKVTGIICHWMVGTLASTDQVFQNRSRNTSAHYGVEDGNVHQYVADENTAYHAGNWDVNLSTIGIEHSAAPGRAPSAATYEASAQLIATLSKKFGFAVNTNTVRPHRAIVATQCCGDVANGGVDLNKLITRANAILGATPAPAPTPLPPVAQKKGTATVTVQSVNVRSQPKTTAPIAGSGALTLGQTFDYVEAVQGESVAGVSTWLKSTRGNFVWAGGTNYATTPPVQPTGGVAQAIRQTNVRVAPNTSAALGGSRTLTAGQTFSYSAKVHGQYVSQNGVSTDLWYHTMVGNYIWLGNCKDI